MMARPAPGDGAGGEGRRAMDRFRFIHAADLHLDSPMLRLEQYDGAPADALRGATREALDALVDLAIAEEVAFVLVAGDLYDGECIDQNTPIAVRRAFARLGAAGIRVFVVQGNHDAASRVTRAFGLELPENVHLFPTDRATTVEVEELRVAVHGRGFPTRAVAEDLAPGFPARVAGWLNIGLLHCTCGESAGHDTYAPTSVAALAALGYDYWALGHIHARSVIRAGDPWIVYPGCIQGRHVRETGPKGATMVEVADGRIASVEHRDLDVLRWEMIELDVSEIDEADEAIDAAVAALTERVDAAESRTVAARVRLLGATAADRALRAFEEHWLEQLRHFAVDRCGEHAWIERLEIATTPLRAGAADGATGVDPAAALLAPLLEADPEADDPEFAAVIADIAKVRKAMPGDPRVPYAIEPGDPAWLAAQLDDLRGLLLGRLFDPTEDDAADDDEETA